MPTLAEIAKKAVYEAALAAATDSLREGKLSPRENAAAALDAAMRIANIATEAADTAAVNAIHSVQEL